MMKKIYKGLLWLLVVGVGILFCMPVLILLCGSIADDIEWVGRMKPVLQNTTGYIKWKWIPDYPTLQHYKELLFYTPQYLVLFWNSIKITACILGGQLFIGVPSAWAFAVYEFKGKKQLFSVYIILMLLPFQVTMLSKYLVLDAMNLYNTQAAVILPAIFSTFPVFLMYRGFSGIPKELLEAARIDGAGEFQAAIKIGLPIAQSCIFATFVLGFLECWNMMEEPLAFLEDKSLWPLSLYLPEIGASLAGKACAASVLVLVVSIFVFVIFKDSLEKGIMFSTLKG